MRNLRIILCFIMTPPSAGFYHKKIIDGKKLKIVLILKICTSRGIHLCTLSEKLSLYRLKKVGIN